MTAHVTFADLVHRGLFRAAVPLGIGLISAYAKDRLGDRIDIKLFKHGDDLASHWENNIPKIACFSRNLKFRTLFFHEMFTIS